MRILVIGQAAFGEHVLRRLLNDGEEVVGVAVPDRRFDPLRVLAEKNALPLFATQDLGKEERMPRLSALKPDLGVMAFVTDILPARVLHLPRLGTIQYHPSLLPKHRGASAIHWAIIQGDTTTGVTVFWPDQGIDTGPILLQKEIQIAPEETLGSLYFKKLFPMGIDALAEALTLVKQGIAPRVSQDESQATRERLFKDEDAVIDWTRPATEVYNLIRGCNPHPGAATTHRSRSIKVLDCRLEARETQGKPGQVMRIDQESFTVALKGGCLRILRVQPRGELKMGAREYVGAGRINAGDYLGV